MLARGKVWKQMSESGSLLQCSDAAAVSLGQQAWRAVLNKRWECSAVGGRAVRRVLCRGSED